MRIIASRNYYQQKKWKHAEMDRRIHKDMARMPSAGKVDMEKKRDEALGRLLAHVREERALVQYAPDCFGLWVFRTAAKMALAVAEHFELNVHIEQDEREGTIRLSADQMLSEAIWKDGAHKRRFLRLIRWADSVWVDTMEEDGEHIVRISLGYCVSRIVPRKRKIMSKP